ncbi:hypothetical protein DWX41_13530 [Hungatella hathewayi]|uniref:Uncharacterized protein n=1 Tax=Hungatella hathewayi TaxID=154046 RepID=A0A3E2WR90_9FIRM|nr:hypothetical protein [Faecalicatena contorta]RGC29833.1 hypothetical protein DWX41_13530 [Hungatella hathewayi]
MHNLLFFYTGRDACSKTGQDAGVSISLVHLAAGWFIRPAGENDFPSGRFYGAADGIYGRCFV